MARAEPPEVGYQHRGDDNSPKHRADVNNDLWHGRRGPIEWVEHSDRTGELGPKNIGPSRRERQFANVATNIGSRLIGYIHLQSSTVDSHLS